jgi:hypothetical protein
MAENLFNTGLESAPTSSTPYYGYNQNKSLEDRSTAIEKSIVSSATSSNLINSSFLNNLIASKPDVVAFYVNALTYGGYTIGDVLNDMKRRELESQGNTSAKSLKIIDPDLERTQYAATAEGQQAKLTASTVIPTFNLAGIMDPAILKYGADMDEDTFKMLVPILDPSSQTFKDAVANIKSSFYDLANAQLEATSEQEKASADYNYNEWKKQVEVNFGIKLSDDAATAWKQINTLEDSYKTQGLAGSGLQNEAIDNYLKTLRLNDQRAREQRVTDANNKEIQVLLASGSPSDIKTAIAKMDAEDAAAGVDPSKFRSILLKPSADVAETYSVANLKAKYPDMTDAQIQAYHDSILDENGNLRSAIYTKYYTGIAANAKSAKDAAETLVTQKALTDEQRAYGDPNNVLDKPTDTGSSPTDTGLTKTSTPDTTTPASTNTNVSTSSGSVMGVSSPTKAASTAAAAISNKLNSGSSTPTPANSSPLGQISTPMPTSTPSTIQTPAKTTTPSIPLPSTTPSLLNSYNPITTVDTSMSDTTKSTIPKTTQTPANSSPLGVISSPYTPVKTSTPAKTGYQGSSIVDYLTSTGGDSSYSSRAALAAKNGITGYTGSATQNTQLLTKLRGY